MARSIAHKLVVSFHVGSQCMNPERYRLAIHDMRLQKIVQAGVTVDIVDAEGGYPQSVRKDERVNLSAEPGVTSRPNPLLYLLG